MRAYYYNFFRGMYEFRNGEYTKAITYYKKAERKIPTISERLKKLSFILSEIYYHMKITHISMHYAELSYHIYKKHELYSVRRIQCHFVIAGNYDDLENHQKLSPTFKDLGVYVLRLFLEHKKVQFLSFEFKKLGFFRYSRKLSFNQIARYYNILNSLNCSSLTSPNTLCFFEIYFKIYNCN